MLGLVALATSCGQAQTQGEKAAQAAAPAQLGAPITADNAITYEALLEKMAAVDSMPAKVSGKVNAVCQKKGCWMTLVSDDPGKPEMRVTFKDYAFFMPKDLSGHRVVIEGYALKETTSVDMLRHFAEDAGKKKEEIEAIKDPKHEMSFEAAGVIILPQ